MPKKKEHEIEEPKKDEEHDAFDDEWYCAKLKDKGIEHSPEDTLYCSTKKKDDDDKDYSDGENWE